MKRYLLKYNEFLNESYSNNNKVLVVVDVQPEYKNYIGFSIPDFIEYVASKYDEGYSIYFLYNGYDTLGMVREEEYMSWLMDWGMEEDLLNNINFYDKGYAFFRSCMDKGVDDEHTINFVKFLYINDVTDSLDLSEEQWEEFMSNFEDHDNLQDTIKDNEDCISIPDLMYKLVKLKGKDITVVGGGTNECLREVEIALKALDIDYNVDEKFTY